MKKLTTISLFIFWAIVVAILTAGLVFYQKQNCPPAAKVNNPVGSSGGQVTLNLAEIAKHNNPSDCWLLINNKVYDVTSFLGAHPGGAGTITPYCGKEATQAFETKDIGRPHSSRAASMLNDYYVGDLNQTIK